MRARLIAGVPGDLTGSLTGLTEGRFPVYAKARYADDVEEPGRRGAVARSGNAAQPPLVRPIPQGDRDLHPRGRPGGRRQRRRGNRDRTRPQGPVPSSLQDVYGNRYSYRGLSEVADLLPGAEVAAARAARRGRLGWSTGPPTPPPRPGASPTARSTPTAAATGRAPRAPPPRLLLEGGREAAPVRASGQKGRRSAPAPSRSCRRRLPTRRRGWPRASTSTRRSSRSPTRSTARAPARRS